MQNREVICDDAVAFLNGRDFAGCSFVSSIPDVSETGMPFATWERWFADCARLLVEKTPADGLLVLTQSDIRHEGRWIDKGYMVTRAALDAGATLISKKIICRKPAGSTSSARSAFTHLMVFSKGLLIPGELPEVVADVLPAGGSITWKRGLGDLASLACIDMVLRYAPASTTVVDPFCGEGMLLAAANRRGLKALGCERHMKRAEKARRLVLPPS